MPLNFSARRQIVRICATLALLLTALVQPPVTLAADPSQFTEAEKILFVTPHLQGLQPGTSLRYDVRRTGSLQEPFDDKALLTIDTVDEKTAALVDYLSGDRNLSLPPFPDLNGNPILLHFLEREIREMNRLTGGSANYYRKRIRMALATDPQVIDISVERDGKSVAATRIRISPYLDDPARARYEKFATRVYEMTLSPAIPGGIVRLAAILHADGRSSDPDKLLWSETVEYAGQE